MRETSAHTHSARRYMLELTGAMVLYALVLVPAIFWIRANPQAETRWIVALLPLIPVVLAAWAILRFFHRMDEMARRMLTEAMAFAFVGSALFVLTLGFLQVAGMPAPSVWWIWTGMGAMWITGSLVIQLRYR